MTTLTGDVTGSGTDTISTTVQPNVVTNAKLAQAPANTLKGNNTGASANAQDLTVSQVRTLLGVVPEALSTLATITGPYGLALETATSRAVKITNAAGHNITSFGTVPAGEQFTLTFQDHLGVAIDNDKVLGPDAVGYQAGDGLAPTTFVSSGYNTLPCWPGDVVQVLSLGPVASGGATRWQVVNYMPWHLFSFGQQGVSGDIGSLAYTYAIGPRGPTLAPPLQDIGFFDGIGVQWENGESKTVTGSLVVRGGNDATGKMFFQMANSQLGAPGTGGPNSPLTANGEILPISSISKDGTKICFQALVDDPAHPGHVRTVGNDVGFFAGHGPSYLSQGFVATINAKCTQIPTVNGTGGTLVFGFNKKNTTTNIDRWWADDIGNFISAGAATLEAATAAHGAWPYDTYYPNNPEKWAAPSGDCDWLNTQGWGNFTAIATDITDANCRNNAAIAIRKYGAHSEGMDIGYDPTGHGTINTYAVHNGTRIAVEKLDPTNNVVTYPTKPAFQAIMSADAVNVTGNGVFYTLPFGAEVFDLGGNFSSGVFTAPASGVYQLQAMVQLYGLSSVMNWFRIAIVTNNRTYVTDQGLKPDGQGRALLQLDALADMAAGHAAYVQIYVAGGAQTVSVMMGSSTLPMTMFSGFLVA